MSKRKEKILGELGFTYAGLSGKTQKDFGRGKPFIPFMNIMSNGKIDPKFMGLVDVAPNERQNAVQKGDLFFTTSSETPEEVGMTSVLLEDVGECYLNSFCFGFRLYNFDDLVPEFAPYLFRGNEVRKQIINLGQGYTRFNLPKTELLKKLRLSLPSENEQKRISEILTKADSIIEKTQSAIAKYKAIKQGMLQDLFTRGIDLNTNKLRPRYQDAPHLYKESKLGWIPRQWDCDSIDNLTDKVGSGVTPTGGSEVYKSQGILFLRSQNILYGKLSLIDVAFIPEEIDEMMENSRAKPFDVLLNITGASIGRCAFFPEELVNANVNQHVCIIRFKTPSKSLAVFASEYLNTDLGQRQMYKAMAVGNREGLNYQQIKAFNFPEIKNPKELEKISSIIESINNKLQTEQTYLQKMQSLKKGLMEDLLSGRKCLNLDFQDEQINQDSKTILQSVNLVNQDADNYPVNPKIE